MTGGSQSASFILNSGMERSEVVNSSVLRMFRRYTWRALVGRISLGVDLVGGGWFTRESAFLRIKGDLVSL